MRRYLSTLKARAATNIGSRAMLTVLVTSIGLGILALLISWATTP